MKAILLSKSPTADTRTCDWSKVGRNQLLMSSETHIRDVMHGIMFFQKCLEIAKEDHDKDKLTDIDSFHADFQIGFKNQDWFNRHLKLNRHHIDKPEGIPIDVNLIDVLEHIVDCVMAGMARSGSVYELKLPDELLQKAFQNTVELLKSHVVVIDKE